MEDCPSLFIFLDVDMQEPDDFNQSIVLLFTVYCANCLVHIMVGCIRHYLVAALHNFSAFR